ncbi:MAG: RDD family protein [Deltaproteobacteria bacterium]|nr:RDD family protein [Deltaproteobacteria bacterium]
MNWHYSVDGQSFGPISEEEFQTLWQRGTIGPHTLVWHEGMTEWTEYRQLTPTTEATVEQAACAECGRTFPREDMVKFGSQLVCASCKNVYVQKMKEGALLSGTLNYAGFWIRFAAKIIDGIILMAVQTALTVVLAFSNDSEGGAGIAVLIYFVQMIIAAAYATFFVGRYQATIGKMACQLKVVYEDGTRISYARALGRHFAEYLSGLILGIGYLMAAFDTEEHRTLHDRICNTRVVGK